MSKNPYATVDRSKYGAVEMNGLENHAEYFAIDRSETVTLTDPRLAQITRLRLLTDPGFPFWDVSYCHGRLKDGTEVRVSLPWFQFKKANGLSREIVAMCKQYGVYAKGLGLLDCISTVR